MTLSLVRDWEIIEDCHEAIISPEEWEQVQEIIDRRPTIMKGNSCPFITCSTVSFIVRLAESPCGAV